MERCLQFRSRLEGLLLLHEFGRRFCNVGETGDQAKVSPFRNDSASLWGLNVYDGAPPIPLAPARFPMVGQPSCPAMLFLGCHLGLHAGFHVSLIGHSSHFPRRSSFSASHP
jgi:hypothetical protein